MKRSVAAVFLFFGGWSSRALAAAPASADDDGDDGVYGRFDGDISFSLGAGVEFDGNTRAALIGRVLYYHSIGLAAGYADGLGSSGLPKRVGFAGMELRPLFLPRWSKSLEKGGAFWDLTLDSVALGVAGYASAPTREHAQARGGVQLSLGASVPLFGEADGLWLEARGFYRPGLAPADLGAWAGLSWYASWLSPFVQ